MIRTCPRCGDFYADGPAAAFCPADGTPLADLDPRGDAWAEAERVVGEKERVLRRRARRLRLRHVLTTTTTVLMTTLVLLVVAVNTYVYLAPEPAAPVVASALTPTPTPAPTRSETPAWTPTPDSTSLPFVPAVTPTPTPEATPTPDRVRSPSGPASPDDTSTPTPTPTPTVTATPTVTETPTVRETPVATETPTIRDEPPRSPTPTPTPDRRHDHGTPDPSRPSRPPDEPAPISDRAPAPDPVRQCGGDDRKRLKRELVARSEAAWASAIMRDRSAVSRQYAPHGVERPEAELLPPIEYEVGFSDACEPVFVRARYKWRISWHGGPPFRSCTKRKDGRKTFPCRKDEAVWRCD